MKCKVGLGYGFGIFVFLGRCFIIKLFRLMFIVNIIFYIVEFFKIKEFFYNL